MFVASYTNTMKNARPKFRRPEDEPVVRDLIAIRRERRAAMAEARPTEAGEGHATRAMTFREMRARARAERQAINDAIVRTLKENKELSFKAVAHQFGKSPETISALWRAYLEDAPEPAEPINDSLDTPRDVIKAIAAQHGVPVEAVLGRSASARIVEVRHRAIVEVYKRFYDPEKERSFPWIGRLFNRDHSSIIHAVKKFGVHKTREANKDAA